MSIWDWPALKEKPPKGIRVSCERAIHGKPDAATRDFDFVAVSNGFCRTRRNLERIFAVKNQQAGGIALWWRYEERYYASYCYPSPLSDSKGRFGLETQILQWDCGSLPPALGAILMLPKVATFTSQDWIKWARDRNFSDPSYTVQLDPVEIMATEADLENVVQRGQAELSKLSGQTIRRFYAALLAGDGTSSGSPALLTGVPSELSPEALATLLLAVPPDRTARCSLAGWPTENLQWDGIACQQAPSNWQPGPAPSQAQDRRAAVMAYAVQRNEPTAADGISTEVREILNFADSSSRQADTTKLPRRNDARLSEAERDLIGEVVLRVASTPEPVYMEGRSQEVRAAFREQMLFKAETIKAWWLLLQPPRDIQEWLLTYALPDDVAEKNWLCGILEMWNRDGNGLASSRLSLVAQFPGSTRSSSA